MRKQIGLIFALAVIIGGAVITYLYIGPVSPYSTENKLSREGINLIIDGMWIEEEGAVYSENNQPYIDFKVAQKLIDENLSLTEAHSRVYYEMPTPTFKMESELLTQLIGQGMKINFLAKKVENRHYIAIEDYAKLLNIGIHYDENYKILNIWHYKTQDFYGLPKNKMRVRPKPYTLSRSLATLHSGDSFRILELGDQWAKIQMENGLCGYAKKSDFEVSIAENRQSKMLNSPRPDWKEHKFHVTWHQVGKKNPDLSKESKKEGLDVLCPTWFSLANERGFIVNNASKNYVQTAHDKGYKVWGLVDNAFNKELTRKFLRNEEGKENFIKLLAFYAALYDLDGINIDFENIYYEDRVLLTDFVRELSRYMQGQNTVISMAVTVPGGSADWSQVFQRKELSAAVDYMMLMAYDEHWASSPVSGSVASIPWVEKGIQGSLEEIPKEKLVLGVPFYNRIWEESTVNGKTKVKSKSVSMDKVQAIIKDKKLEPTWLPELGQSYVEYMENGKTYKIWIEDEASIAEKTKLIDKYHLAGIGSWKKGLGLESIWKVIEKNLNK